MGKHNFKEILAWKKMVLLTPKVYSLLTLFPNDEKYALTSQIKRAVISVSSNLAEGSGRNSKKDFAHFLDIALGSCNEIESQLYVAVELKFITFEQCEVIINNLIEVQRLIVGFRKSLTE